MIPGGCIQKEKPPRKAWFGFFISTPLQKQAFDGDENKKTDPEYSGPVFLSVGSTGFEPVTPCL